MIISDTYEGRDIKILGVLSIVDEAFSFFMRVYEIREMKLMKIK